MLSLAQITGQDNSHLVALDQGHQLLPQVATDFVSMQQAAREDGVDLTLASSFRSFSRQLTIWNDKWHGRRPVLDIHEKQVDIHALQDKDKCFAILTFSALPGASRHHFGSDMDVYDMAAVSASGQPLQLLESEYSEGGPCHSLSCWLEKHSASFGFFRPYARYQGGVAAEPWHISHQQQADVIMQQLSTDALRGVLAQTDIAGKASILEHLDEIYRRFILNRGAN
ncbi:M15 family metallopeptidase [Aliiglaciecola sp. CAU 1673]|uniref:M15 family metallopeptidase n=1 Tax=Aliiglaciecola sp. CAU 1673 TaxID=3032595 RepID=UPI0023DC2EC2|nr:M15 family metallopeptidase [Aliiglaciecola sp. CAU 1673]MDF2177743.1 M15 family metallopeptidase [Aliiglaciecola sp. CAU 1673]